MPHESVIDGLVEKVESCLSEELDQVFMPHSSGVYSSAKHILGLKGKRIRSKLLLATAHFLDENPDNYIHASAGVESFHLYSLLHDDLPSFDNSSMRKDKPTARVLFGEAQATMAGTLLYGLGHALVLKNAVNLGLALREYNKVHSYLESVSKMLHGEEQDLAIQKGKTNVDDRQLLESAKNKNKIFSACLALPAYLLGKEPRVIGALDCAGSLLGLAYQLKDDLDDITKTKDQMGKPNHQDKDSYAIRHGADKTRKLIEDNICRVKGELSIVNKWKHFPYLPQLFDLIRS